MNLRKKQINLVIATLLICITLIFSFSTIVKANDYAYSCGTTNFGLDTTADVLDAAYAYYYSGYDPSIGALDSSKNGLLNNLGANVQFFATHGFLDRILFGATGIIVGSDFTEGSREFIGTNNNNINWEDDTILVTYATCEGMGEGGTFSYDSIGYATAVKGADVVLGWRETIGTDSARKWSQKYHTALSGGMGVNDAADYASMWGYVDSSVHKWTIVNHGNANIKIGNYRNRGSSIISSIASNLMESRNILKNTRTVVNDDINSIIVEIKKSYPNFNIENYEIQRISGGNSIDVNTNEIIEYGDYIDIKFRVGDFYTDAGYKAKVKDGIVLAIYNNNVDVAKQEQALLNKDSFKANLDNTEINSMKTQAVNDIKSKYNIDDFKITDDSSEIWYYYDITMGKKYICITVLSEIEEAKAYNTIKYEI